MPTSILDDLEAMRGIDKSNMLGFCVEAAKHYRESAEKAKKIQLTYPTPENVVVAGMGGSAIGGELAKDLTRETAKIPIEISREYKLPVYADKKSLVVLASYSGETEETLSSLADAVNRKCMIFCLSSGGTLIKYAQKLCLPHLKVEGGMPPRGAMPHMLMPLLRCLEETGAAPKISGSFVEPLKLLETVALNNGPKILLEKNFAKTLAINLNDTAPAIYGFGLFRGAALRLKQQLNENAKIPAKWETFSELNHNETMGWENPGKLSECFSVVFLRDKTEPLEIRSRIETTRELMQRNVERMYEVWAEGKSNLAKLLSIILICDFASVYLSYLRGIDPTPVKTVTVMKQRIEKNGVKAKIIKQLESMSGRS